MLNCEIWTKIHEIAKLNNCDFVNLNPANGRKKYWHAVFY